MREILSDLVAEQQSLDQFLQRIHERDWKLPTPAKGWSIHDTVSHLASTETLGARVIAEGWSALDTVDVSDLDRWTAEGVKLGRRKRYQEVIEWWRNGRAAVVDALSHMEADDRIPWLHSTVSAKAFASIRLMETWAHGLDIRAAMHGRLPVADDEEPETDSARLYHVAWLVHRTLPYAFAQAGETYPEQGIRIQLIGPKYSRWDFGPENTDIVVKGMAGEFCRVAVHRMKPTDTNLKAIGPDAETALRLLRAY